MQSLWPILGTLFHPMYMLINARILGNLELDPIKCGPDATKEVLASFDCVDNKSYLAAFGLASATIGILFLAPGICYSLALGNIVP